MADAPRVFLSYSHDSDEHADRVLALADALCNLGIDVVLDRYVHPAPAEGWPRWMDRNLDQAQFVLMVCTAIYHRRVMDREDPGQGLGVRWVGSLIYNRIYHDRSSGSRFIPVLLPGSEPAHIPNPVLGHSYYRIARFDLTDLGFEALYRHLTDQSATPRPDVRALTSLPPRPRPRPAPGPQSPSGGPTTNGGGNPKGGSRDAAPTPTVAIITASSPMRVICPLHGIRTLAVWQKGLSDLAGTYGWVCRLDRWSYGRFSLLAFVTPWSREAKLGWLRRQYDAETHDRRLLIEKGQAPSVVAHSFGTYILGYTLLRFDFIRFNKVLLCGSILPRDFPWDQLIARGQVQAVRNEFGVRDPWVRWVRWFVRGTGPSGASGFACRHERLEQEEFDFNHGDYFGIDHMEDRWIPFLNKPLEEIPRSDVGDRRIPRPRTSAPWGLYGLALTAFLIAIILGGLLWSQGESPRPPPPPPARGQNALRELRGKVYSIEKGEQSPQPFGHVLVTIEFGPSALTNDQGLFRIQLASPLQPGQEVTLQLDKKGYAIYSPFLGKQLVPADPSYVVQVHMLPERSMAFLASERIEEFITRTVSETAKQLKSAPSGETDLSAYILELARYYGFTADEVRHGIETWMEEARKDTNDFRKQGMVAFAEKNFRLAGDNFGRSADEEARQGAEKFRKSAADRELSGDSYYNALEFRQALKTYQTALKALNDYHAGLGDLELKVYPEYATDVQNVSFKYELRG